MKESYMQGIRWRVLMIGAIAFGLGLPSVVAGPKLRNGEWVAIITAPDSPSGNHFGVRTVKFEATEIDTPESSEEIRELSGTMDGDSRISGVWRQEGRDFSLAFELPCEPGITCGTIILRGRLKSKRSMRGVVILMWDTPDNSNVARYETVNGSFEGVGQ